MELSKKSIQEVIQRLQRIENRTQENFMLATKDLMEATYQALVDVFNSNNLSNHINSINRELTNDGLGFRIWTNDWIVIFNEFGTGISGQGTYPSSTCYSYNSHKPTEKEIELNIPENHWIYYKDGKFYITSGMPAKHMFYDVERLLNEYVKEFYQSAIKLAINDEQYQSFKASLRG